MLKSKKGISNNHNNTTTPHSHCRKGKAWQIARNYTARVQSFTSNQITSSRGCHRRRFVASKPSHIPSQILEPNHQPCSSRNDSKSSCGNTASTDSKITIDISFFMQHLHTRLLLYQPCKTAYALSFELMGVYIKMIEKLRMILMSRRAIWIQV